MDPKGSFGEVTQQVTSEWEISSDTSVTSPLPQPALLSEEDKPHQQGTGKIKQKAKLIILPILSGNSFW